MPSTWSLVSLRREHHAWSMWTKLVSMRTSFHWQGEPRRSCFGSPINTMPQYLTREGLQKLKDELHELKTVKIPENIKLIKYAAAEGDLKENAGYHDARERKTWLLRRMQELENAINDAVIYEKKASDKVQIGAAVEMLLDGEKQTYEMVAPGEANILEKKMSYQSPLGSQLMNKKVGEEFNYEIRGNKMKVKILAIK